MFPMQLAPCAAPSAVLAPSSVAPNMASSSASSLSSATNASRCVVGNLSFFSVLVSTSGLDTSLPSSTQLLPYQQPPIRFCGLRTNATCTSPPAKAYTALGFSVCMLDGTSTRIKAMRSSARVNIWSFSPRRAAHGPCRTWQRKDHLRRDPATRTQQQERSNKEHVEARR